ncbi:LysR family transcriptional regulator [Bdellovibrio reynosensis]|uniref:LysR family transcriptional regulator n=1 Tax=Bdellovibrio reynosensis TaxID=2835041 RepID=A0ABY4CH56_9BACT|nr:LysR family transcriptional regulator [Bdellovibrio reynosensis]UOF02908.1 LysR family transcriptional regulator [Bdellovibrio reynosensis]
MQWLNYHHLYYFRAIANEGGIAKASEKLRIGQPTLSTQLRQLEDILGKSLFERRHRKLVLTEAGKAALDYANEIFRLGDEMLEVIKDQTSQNQTHLQIGALDGVPKNVLLSLAKEAYKIAPCTVSILEGRGDELLRELRAHRLDLIVSNYPAQLMEEEKVYSKSVAKMPVAVYGSAKFGALKKSFPQSLNGKPFVLPTLHSKLRHDLNHFFKLKGIHIEPVAETQDTSLQKLLAEDGLGLAPLSEMKNLKEKNLIRLGRLEGVYEELWLISAQRKIENPIAAKLMQQFSL